MTNELTVTNIISLFEMTKADRSSFITRLVDAMEEGGANPLNVHLQVKNMESIIKGLTSTSEKDNKDNLEAAKRYMGLVLEEATKYGKDFEYHNAKMKIAEVCVKYSYAECNDPEVVELETKLSKLNEALKARQKFLQTLPTKGITVTNEETGDTYTIYPPSKTSTTSVNVTLK